MNETKEITLNKSQLPAWIAEFQSAPSAQHLIITLSETDQWLKKDLKPLVTLAKTLNKQGKSLAVVNRELALEDMEIALHIAPTLQEAHDLIELDEIERDLWK